MEKQEKVALINNKEVTDEYLFKQACNLTSISQELRVVTDLLEQFNYINAKKDTVYAAFFLKQGKLDNAADVLRSIVDQVSQASNDICPDMD